MFILTSFSLAEDPVEYSLQDDNSKSPLFYNTEKYALIYSVDKELDEEPVQVSGIKSGWTAAFLSAVLPGAGEFYAKSYWKTALFATIEVAALTGYFVYENKGDDEDRRMKNYGDTHWSEQRYWSRVYQIAETNGLWDYEDLIPEGSDIIPDENYNAANIARLRDIERNAGLAGFTHSLPETKTQQYYEMIYKYLHQFGSGWDDVPFSSYYETQPYPYSLTPNIAEYRKMRNRSNDYYETATTMTSVVLLNHLISAFDAALTVRQYNKKLQYSFNASAQRYAGEIVRTYGITLSW
jgi:hypothetical protein